MDKQNRKKGGYMNIERPTVELNEEDYNKDVVLKKTIFIHHTAGWGDPNSAVRWWNRDNKQGISTPYLIGGPNPVTGDASWDGRIIQTYNDKYWSYHLGVNTRPKIELTAIGIELCNLGYLEKQGNRFFSPVIGKFIEVNQVIELDVPFRGYKFYHKYSERQIESLRQLILDIAGRHNINIKAGLQELIRKEGQEIPEGLTTKGLQSWLKINGYVGEDGKPLELDGHNGRNTRYAASTVGQEAFEYSSLARHGGEGLWTHTNVRQRGKFDCSPQPALKEMIMSL